MPPTLVTKDLKIIEEFLNKEEDIITKPLYGNGGEGIHRFDKTNFNSKILDEYLHLPIMVQKFINEIEHGDRRIIFFDGEYLELEDTFNFTVPIDVNVYNKITSTEKSLKSIRGYL